MAHEFKSIADYVKDQPPVPGVLYRIPNQPLVIGITSDRRLLGLGDFVVVGFNPEIKVPNIREAFDLNFPRENIVGDLRYRKKIYPCYAISLFGNRMATMMNRYCRESNLKELPDKSLDTLFLIELNHLMGQTPLAKDYGLGLPEVEIKDTLDSGWVLQYRGEYWGLVIPGGGGVRDVYGWTTDPKKIEVIRYTGGETPPYKHFNIAREDARSKRQAARGRVMRATIKTSLEIH